jgi:fatty-acyl-CoA synthase
MTSRMLVGQHVEHNARRFARKIALRVAHGAEWTYAELNGFANRAARALRAAGIGHGDKVALLCDSRLEWVGLYVGIVKLGAVAVPVNYRLTPAEIAANLVDADVGLLLALEALAAPVRAQLPQLRCVVIDGTHAEGLTAFLAGHAPSDIASDVKASDANVILFTGGTTGRSKGVVLSHENLFWNSLDEIIDTHMHEGDNTLLATPLHHSAALNCWLLPHLYLGATATLLPKYSAEAMLRAIDAHRVTNAFSPPSMAREVYLHPLAREVDLSSFRRWYIGGGVLADQDRDAIHALIPGLRIYYQYGLTEAGPIVTVLKEEDVQRGAGSIGRAFINFEVKILTGDLSDAKPGEEGEIAVRGPAVMAGYYRQPEATRAVFHAGWLRTGDSGVMDAEGFVYFRDRLKDMVKTGGLNVYSQEVEHVLAQHPAVREVGIIGMPSDKWGEEVTAIVALRPDRSVEAEELIAYARTRLAGYKVPKRVLFIPYEEMPINFSGKVMKRELRARFLPQA